ncbi:hypothetical protein C1752_01571 [Acaryochloris thomasi RCC1774]|uniref:Uncharacterized protein n=1 Tax=Acaryochloris thomasi RCC1774 TaxID=1764569 RepID=A0A2W1K081_9CYAN|nr:hypothetical protein C1752_01571 [Acaryochloris thomasi RCC1774]
MTLLLQLSHRLHSKRPFCSFLFNLSGFSFLWLVQPFPLPY